MRATRAIIHLGNLKGNIKTIREHSGGGKPICMAIKADAYGHGAVESARAALEAGVESFGVASVREGVELREAGIDAPLILFGIALREELPELVAAGLVALVADEAYTEALDMAARQAGRDLEVHIKVDTGMGRIGCGVGAAPDLAAKIAASSRLRLAGLCTHFPVADSTAKGDMAFTEAQIDAFAALGARLEGLGHRGLVLHAANSGAVLFHPRAAFGMLRPGILCYGYAPCDKGDCPLALKPVMELESRAVFVKEVSPGQSVSYGRAWTASRTGYVATIAAGYADGYPRALSGRAEVLIEGRRAPVAGRVCMDQFMVDLGARPCAPEARAVLFGPDPEGPDAAELASIAGGIPYEITCGVSKRVPRVYVA
jgi:alanine racemase